MASGGSETRVATDLASFSSNEQTEEDDASTGTPRSGKSAPKDYIRPRIHVLCVCLSSHTCLVGRTVHLPGWPLALAWVTGYVDVVSMVIAITCVSVHSHSRRSLAALYVDNTSAHSIIIFMQAGYNGFFRKD